jgi:predicted phage tail component-like protein
MTTFTFDGVSSTTIPELLVKRVRRPLVAARRDEFVKIPGREGFWLFPEQAGSRTLTIELDILADSFEDRRAAVIALADLFDSPEELANLIVDDEPDRFHRCRLSSDPDPEEWLNHAEASIDLIAEPYAYALTPSVETFSAISSGSAQAFSVPDTVYGIPEIEVTANAGTVTSLVVELNGYTLTYGLGATGLTAGQTLTISTIGYVVTRGTSGDPNLVGDFVPANLDMATVSGDFGYIAGGSNALRVTRTGTAVSLDVLVRWRRRSR